MEFVRIEYTGWKPYTDRTPLKTAWTPGDIKPIPAVYKKGLLRFAEFKLASEQTSAPSEELAMAETAQVAVDQAKTEEHAQVENMLMSIESMDKATLTDYAAKYDTVLDKRLAVGKLREEVATLVEQFGVR